MEQMELFIPSNGFEKIDLGTELDDTNFRMRKRLVRVGKYQKSDWDKPENLSGARLKRMMQTVKQMHADGFKVPLTKGHGADAEILGYLDAQSLLMEKTEDGEHWLTGEFDITGKENANTVITVNQVSIGINSVIEDRKGGFYPEGIDHVALTAFPVVGKQDDGFQIAASLALAIDINKEDTMNKDFMETMSTLFSTEVTEENMADTIATRFAEMHKKLDDAMDTIKDLQSKTVPHIDNESMEDRAELYGERIDRLANDGKIPMGLVAEFKSVLIGDEGKRFALGLTSNGGTEKPLAKQVISLLEQIPTREYAEATGNQFAVLSPQGRDGTDKLDEDVLAIMTRQAGIK